MANNKITDEDLDLLEELGVDAEPAQTGGRSAREQRIIAGFEEIVRFVEEKGRLPEHGENRDIFERLYAVRLEQIRHSPECLEVLRDLDSRNLLGRTAQTDKRVLREDVVAYSVATEPSDEELLAELGVDATAADADIFDLKHVRSRDEIKAAEEIAQRNRCEDFNDFKPHFEAVASDLASGKRQSRKIRQDGSFLKTAIKKGEFFIVGGQTVYIAELGEAFKAPNGDWDARLRVIYSNGTESNLLLRSLQRALYKDPTSRHITEPNLGPLFSGEEDEDDQPTGHIYVLRSKSDHPFVAQNRLVLHKIGVTGGEVKARIANAKKDPTYLLAEVEIVATFKLSNINRKKLEALLHKFFASARLDMELKDRFGGQVEPQEWFLVPLPVIEEAIEKLIDGSITDYRYDPKTAGIVVEIAN